VTAIVKRTIFICFIHISFADEQKTKKRGQAKATTADENEEETRRKLKHWKGHVASGGRTKSRSRSRS